MRMKFPVEIWPRVSVETPVASDAACEHETDREEEKYRIDAHRPGEHEVQVHEETEKCGNAGKESDDEPESDEHFADRDGV